ncbi:MAG: hypothetical protein HUJ65_03135 [Oscillospiraceae bacterium]|nr:hypothetical protein [Oscillospiraceae bacterium]
MNIELTEKEYRRLLDIVYIGNWVLNSTRLEHDRFLDYDIVESKIFAHCSEVGMNKLIDISSGVVLPSRAFEDGGIHEAIADYEDAIFFDILSEELARRDIEFEHGDPNDFDDLERRIEEYLAEFDANGLDNVSIDK